MESITSWVVKCCAFWVFCFRGPKKMDEALADRCTQTHLGFYFLCTNIVTIYHILIWKDSTQYRLDLPWIKEPNDSALASASPRAWPKNQSVHDTFQSSVSMLNVLELMHYSTGLCVHWSTANTAAVAPDLLTNTWQLSSGLTTLKWCIPLRIISNQDTPFFHDPFHPCTLMVGLQDSSRRLAYRDKFWSDRHHRYC